MELWILLLFMNLFFLFTMIRLGKQYLNSAPQNANSVFSYRTRMSSINRNTWKFAHNYLGRIWYISGLTLLIPSLIVMLSIYGKSSILTGIAGGITAAVPSCGFSSRIFDKIISMIFCERNQI